MQPIIYDVAVSIDGYIAGPDGDVRGDMVGAAPGMTSTCWHKVAARTGAASFPPPTVNAKLALACAAPSCEEQSNRECSTYAHPSGRRRQALLPRTLPGGTRSRSFGLSQRREPAAHEI